MLEVSPDVSRLRLELQDPLTDVTTPEVTDSEPEDQDEVNELNRRAVTEASSGGLKHPGKEGIRLKVM